MESGFGMEGVSIYVQMVHNNSFLLCKIASLLEEWPAILMVLDWRKEASEASISRVHLHRSHRTHNIGTGGEPIRVHFKNIFLKEAWK